jgi:hypothetical protein
MPRITRARGLSLRGFRPIAAGRATQRANRTPVSLVYGAGEGIRTLDPDLGKVMSPVLRQSEGSLSSAERLVRRFGLVPDVLSVSRHF